jgi:hypothetical protein
LQYAWPGRKQGLAGRFDQQLRKKAACRFLDSTPTRRLPVDYAHPDEQAVDAIHIGRPPCGTASPGVENRQAGRPVR